MAGMHLYMGYTQPLFIQALMGVKNLYDAKPVAIYILGKPAEGDLKRPFKAGGGMFGRTSLPPPQYLVADELIATPEPATDKAAIAEAEKRIGGKKEE